MNKEKTGVPGLYIRRLTLTLHDIQRHRRLANYLLRLYRYTGIAKTFSPITNQILCSLPTLSFVPAFLQAYTLCRFNELEQINLSDIKTAACMTIISSKGEHTRSVPAFPVFKAPTLRSLDPKTKIIVISYDKYKHDIKVCLRFTHFVYQENILDCTHIFRHLEASWKFQQGSKISDISKLLGHKSVKTTGKYIHKTWKF